MGDVAELFTPTSAGNQALKRLMADRIIRPKLNVSQPEEPEELDADRNANAFVGGAIHRKCASCEKEEEDEDNPHQSVHRSALGPGSSDLALSGLAQSQGSALPISLRREYERFFDADLSRVRSHTGPQAEHAARRLNAAAFTIRNDIFFGAGRFDTRTTEGKRLLAHELTHVVQGSSTQPASHAHRAPLDPANTTAWDWYGQTDTRRKDPSFLQTVGAAPGAAKELSKTLGTATAPKTDEEREAIKKQIETLIRLNAVTMVGAHRTQLAQTKQLFLDMAAAPTAASDGSGASATSGAADTAKAVRTAAQLVTKLTADKAQIQGLRDDIDSAVRQNSGAEAINDEYKTLWDKAQPFSAPIALQKLLETRNQLKGGGLSTGSKKVVLFDLRNELLKLRDRQIKGIDSGIAATYAGFPFLADLSAEFITTGKTSTKTKKAAAFGLGVTSIALPFLAPVAAYLAHDVYKKDQPPDDQGLLTAVQSSFDKLLANTDEAIVKVGSGSMEPLDLPGAVIATRNALAPVMQTELDRIKEAHEVAKFTKDMILVFGIAVLTGVTGGLAGLGVAAWAAGTGAVAAGMGAYQLGGQLKDMTDRQTLSNAATNPDGSLLGVSAPSLFEWTMFAVGAALTAADLAVVAREIAALRPTFQHPPELPSARPDPHSGGKTPEGGKPPEGGAKLPEGTSTGAPGDVAAGPGIVKPSNPAEARILEAGRGDAPPSVAQIDSELAIVERTEPRKIPGTQTEEVALPNGHSWQSSEGNWCRFSNGRICVPKTRGKKATGPTIATEKDIDAFIEPHRPVLDQPPASVKTPEDLVMWELYNEYFAERVGSMRADLRSPVGKTERELPRTFDDFRSHYTANPKLLDVLRGNVRQGQIGSAIADITSGQAAQNLGVSRVKDPTAGVKTYRPDFVWKGRKGYTAVTSKSRDFRDVPRSELKKTVQGDVKEALEKYFGEQYIRRRGVDLYGEQIDIDEVILNYDGALVPEEIRGDVYAYAKEYGGGGIDVGYFDFGAPK